MEQNQEMKEPTSNNNNAKEPGTAEEVVETTKEVPHVFAWLIDLFWIRPALWGRYLSRTMPLTVTDGIHLTVWQRWGALAPPAALLIGLLFGWFNLGYAQVYSESIIFLLLAVMFGIFSANLGLMFLLGFIVGEFILALDWSTTPGWGRDSVVENILLYRVPLLITYGLLAFLIVKIPVLTKQLLVQVRPPKGFSTQAKMIFSMVGHTLLTGFMVYFWLQIMPVLIRPVFTWLSRSPNVEAIQNFQVYGWLLVSVAVLTSISRIYIQSRTVMDPHLGRRLDTLEEKMEQKWAAKPEVTPFNERLSPWVHTVLVSIMLTLVLSGLYESWADAFILGTFILILQAARKRLIPVPLGKWPEWMERIPLLYRLIIGFIIIFFISRAVLDYFYSSHTFRPVIVLTGLAMLIIFLLNPGSPKKTEHSSPPASAPETVQERGGTG